MEPGELEHRKAFEETATQNIRTVIDYSTATRALIRDFQKKVDAQDKQIISLNKLIEDLRVQLSIVQASVYKGGTV